MISRSSNKPENRAAQGQARFRLAGKSRGTVRAAQGLKIQRGSHRLPSLVPGSLAAQIAAPHTESTRMDVHASLVTRMAQGDRSALSELYRALEKPVYRFILSRLNDPFEAADILHDVFIDVWKSADRFEGRSKVQTWIMGIAYRKVIDQHRKRGRQELRDEMPDEVDANVDTEMCVAAVQEAAHLRVCLDTLKPDHRDAIHLAFYQDMTYADIAQAVATAEGTIKTRIFHAKKLLLKCLETRMRGRAAT